MAAIISELVNLISFKVKNSTEVRALSATNRIKNSINELQARLDQSGANKSFFERRIENTNKIIRKLDDQISHASGNFAQLNNSLNIQFKALDKYTAELKKAKDENNRLINTLNHKKAALAKVEGLITSVDDRYQKWSKTLHSIDRISRSIQYKIGAPLAAMSGLAIKTAMDFEILGVALREAFADSNIKEVSDDIKQLSKDTLIDQRKITEMMIQLKNSGYTESEALAEIKRQRMIQIATNPTGNVESFVSNMAEIKRKGYADVGDIRQFGPEIEKKIRKQYGIPVYMNLEESFARFGGQGLKAALEKALDESAGQHFGALRNYQISLTGSFQSMVISFTNFLNSLGESFAGKGLAQLFDLVSKLLELLSKPIIIDFLATILAVLTVFAASGVIGLVSKLVLFLPSFLKLFTGFITAGSLVARMATPLGLIITILTLLPAAFKGLEWIKELINPSADKIAKKTSADKMPIFQYLKPIKNDINVTVNTNGNTTTKDINAIRDAVTKGVTDSLQKAGNFYLVPGLQLD